MRVRLPPGLFIMNEQDEKDFLETFRLLMFHLGTTYPKRTFNRRINLLTKKELKEYEKRITKLFDRIYDEFGDEIDNIDEIMGNRAEIAKDKWP